VEAGLDQAWIARATEGAAAERALAREAALGSKPWAAAVGAPLALPSAFGDTTILTTPSSQAAAACKSCASRPSEWSQELPVAERNTSLR
jgi:hypothetical protein